MNETSGPSTTRDPPAGYRSEESKRKFTITAGILGAVFFVGQFAVPMLLMFLLFRSVGDFDMDEPDLDPHKTAVWEGWLWYVEEPPGVFSTDPTARLKRVSLEDWAEPETVAEIDEVGFFPLAGVDRLWLISKKSVAVVEDGQIERVTKESGLGEFSHPFLLDGAPAVFKRWPTGLILLEHDGEQWQETGELTIVNPDPECACGLNWARAVADQHGVHVFLEFGDSLFYGLWQPAGSAEVEWQPAGEAGADWYPLVLEGAPFVIVSPAEGVKPWIKLVRLEPDGPREVLTYDAGRVKKLAAYPMPGPNRILAVTQSWSSKPMRLIEITGDSVSRDESVGRISSMDPSDFGRNFVLALMVTQYGVVFTLPLILALIMSVLMRRHRTGSFTVGDSRADHASVARRAVAQLVDAVILVWPFPVAMYAMTSSMWFDSLDAAEGFRETLVAGWPFVASLAWVVLVFFVFVVTEGRWGVTPGKLAARIRVLGTDLRPCGFGRALVRNLLKFIDGLFNFLVGVMIVALTENWQRLGDMAARTIVVDVRRREGAGAVGEGLHPIQSGS